MRAGGPSRWAEALLRRLVGEHGATPGLLGDLAEEWHDRRRRHPAWLCDLRYLGQGASVAAWRLLSSEPPWRGLVRDLGQAARVLARRPGFTVLVVLTLGMAIGANSAVFGIADRLLLQGPKHVQEPDGILRVYGHVPLPQGGTNVTDRWGYVTYTDLAASSHLAAVAAYSASDRTMGQGADAVRLRVGYATAGFFPLLGVEPRAGRFFAEDEAAPGSAIDVAVLDAGFWRRRYGADPDVLGRTVEIGGEEFAVVGVSPEGFTGVDLEPVDVWLPMAAQGRRLRADWPSTRRASWVRIVARLRPGVDPGPASERATAVHQAAATAEAPDELRSRARLELLPLGRNASGVTPPETAIVRWLLAVAGLVLLIAMANVSSLQLARGARRRREVSVRLSLGVTRGGLVRLFLAESVLLATLAGLTGLLVAHLGSGAIRAVLLPDIAWPTPPVSGRVLAFSLAVTTFVAVVVGLIPALPALKRHPGSLHPGVRGGGDAGGRMRRILLVAQPCLALVLLVGAGLFVASLSRVQAIRVGFDAERVLVASPSWTAAADGADLDRDRGEATNAAAMGARDHFARLPWVESASLSLGLPFYTSFGVRTRPDGAESPPPLLQGEPSIMGVTEEYFATVGTTRLRGRLFAPEDRAGGELVTVVNEAMAAGFWPGEDALGRCLTLYDDRVPCVRVVGVVENIKQWSVTGDPALMFYVPFEQAREIAGPMLLVRPAEDADEAHEAVRRELLALWPDLPWVDVFSLQQRIDPQLRPWRMGALLFSMFGGLALLVAVSGLFSVLAYLVEQRRREMGVRSALGASRRVLVVDTMVEGLAPAAAGLALGGLLAVPLGSWLEPLLYGTDGHDPFVLGGAGALLLLASVAGTVLPALRAARTDPAEVLREE